MRLLAFAYTVAVQAALVAEAVDISRLRVRQGPNARALIAYENSDRRFLGSRSGVRGQWPEDRHPD